MTRLIFLRYRASLPKKREAHVAAPFVFSAITIPMTQNQDLSGNSRLPLPAAVDLQDHLLTASDDLERLQALLADATDALMREFFGASGQIRAFAEQPRPCGSLCGPQQYDGVMQHLASAVIALQFQDMASQLIAHTRNRLRNCADRIAGVAIVNDEDEDEAAAIFIEELPLRPNPVTQDQMSAGSIDLF